MTKNKSILDGLTDCFGRYRYTCKERSKVSRAGSDKIRNQYRETVQDWNVYSGTVESAPEWSRRIVFQCLLFDEFFQSDQLFFGWNDWECADIHWEEQIQILFCIYRLLKIHSWGSKSIQATLAPALVVNRDVQSPPTLSLTVTTRSFAYRKPSLICVRDNELENETWERSSEKMVTRTGRALVAQKSCRPFSRQNWSSSIEATIGACSSLLDGTKMPVLEDVIWIWSGEMQTPNIRTQITT